MNVLVSVKRVPETGARITLTADSQAIDTSLLGHSYEASCKPVRDDLGLLIGKGFAPTERKLPPRQSNDGLAYWAFP